MTLADVNPVALRSLGPIALAAGLGMAALYVLLPRPRMLPRWLGAAALVAAAIFVTRAAGPRAPRAACRRRRDQRQARHLL